MGVEEGVGEGVMVGVRVTVGVRVRVGMAVERGANGANEVHPDNSVAITIRDESLAIMERFRMCFPLASQDIGILACIHHDSSEMRFGCTQRTFSFGPMLS